jgi:hypothetical protein
MSCALTNGSQGTHAPSSPSAFKLDPNSDIVSSAVGGLCKDCMVLYAQADASTKDGKKVDIGSGVYSHHLIMINFGHPMVSPPVFVMCPNGLPGSMVPPLMASPKGGKSGNSMGGMGHGRHSRRQTAGASGSGMNIVPNDCAIADLFNSYY